MISIRLGAFDGDPGIRPTYRQFVAYAAPWEPIPTTGSSGSPRAVLASAVSGRANLGPELADANRLRNEAGDEAGDDGRQQRKAGRIG